MRAQTGESRFLRRLRVPPLASALWIYRRLFARFGPQGWWPVGPCPDRSAVYDRRWTQGKLTSAQRWEILVGAVLAQNTAWKNAERALENLRRDGLLAGDRLFAASRVRLERRIRPAGFFRAKTQRLRDLARALADRPGGLDGLLSQPLSQARAELLSFSGIGPETADVVLLYAGGRAVFVADAYAKRLAHRLGLFRYNTYAMAQTFFHQRLPRRVSLYREAHALIVAHAKAHCRARPLCAGCPLLTRCPTVDRHG